jgi:isopenicillin N synthase-like dioxygenase
MLMSAAGTNDRVPQLDLRRFDAGEAARVVFLEELRAAAHGVGFFYIAGHGVETALLRDLMQTTRRFFALPEADKLAIEMISSPHFRGYNRIASERTRLLRAFALALGQPADALEPLYGDDPHYLIKLIRYPGHDVNARQGVGAHKDAGLITLLLQDDQAGLQVETPGGWVDVPPRAGTFVINIGELLELASDGYLRATMHRVITPPSGIERISAAFFLGARLDATVPLLHLPPTLATQARGPEHDPQNPLFREVGLNYMKGRLRSHPDVAQRHHADLLKSEKPQ